MYGWSTDYNGKFDIMRVDSAGAGSGVIALLVLLE
jgi:hypothetical protein